MAGIRTGMAEPLAAVVALEGLLARMDADVLLQVVLQLERLITVVALEFAQHRRLLVADHVTLQAVHVGKGLAALGTRLKAGGGDGRDRESVRLVRLISKWRPRRRGRCMGREASCYRIRSSGRRPLGNA